MDKETKTQPRRSDRYAGYVVILSPVLAVAGIILVLLLVR